MESQTVISKDILIEDLLETVPGAVTYLMQHGIKCIACGEPIWGTLGQAAQEKGFTDQEIDVFVAELRALAEGHSTVLPLYQQ
ncbi:MAG: hybrid cluster protein-associated redox disulfide domain protein [Bacteroidetes bacterium]|nr:hybrid cluster protein-associated redox disulfide domain protein [Bacteroidota bacterium]